MLVVEVAGCDFAGHLFAGWFLQNALMTPMVCPLPASYRWPLLLREY
ncbi:hypothetical protein ACF09H_22525 [Streptomyces sp. NPDC014983]